MTAFPKFIGYMLIKWILFYTYQFTNSSTKWHWNNANSEGLFLAVFMLLAFPLIELVVFFPLLKLALRQKGMILISLLVVIFGLEFLMGWIVTNQRYEVWMVVKIALSVSIFWLMYRKQLGSKQEDIF